MNYESLFPKILRGVGIWCLACLTATAQTDPATPPNIILLMGDDHGWEETGYNGHPHVKTPVLDDMAAGGLRLDRFYSAHPSCSPTRGSVLTGRHPNRYGTFAPGRSIRPQEITLAQVVGKAGYATGHFGKWHLGPVKADSPTNPGAMGFDEWFSHDNFFELNPTLSRNGGPPKRYEGEGSKIIIDETKRFIEEAAKKKKAFLAVVWFGSPHEPYSGLKEDLALYDHLPSKYSGKMVSLTSNETGTRVQRPLGDVLRERYAEITAMDRAIGDLRKFLDREGLRENTVVWYCGDNGTPPSGVAESPLRGMKGQMFEGGIRVPGVIEWPARVAKPHRSTVNAVTSDMLPTICELTGQPLPNRPLDGISLVDLIDAKMEERPKPMAFWSFSTGGRGKEPYIDPELQKGTTPLVKLAGGIPTRNFRNNHHPSIVEKDYGGERTIMDNRHKLLISKKGDVQLFDLTKDPAETTDLAESQPAIAGNLQEQLRAWQTSVLNSLMEKDYDDPETGVPLINRSAETKPHAGASGHDLVIYGGTSAGIVAGIQALEMGKTVVVIEPTEREGGLTTGGLGQTDIGNKMVIGGLSREFYQRIASYYSKPESWKWQKRADYRDGGQTRTGRGEETMWTFEPSAALTVFRKWMSEIGLEVVRQERLNREDGVEKKDGRIVAITMESGRVFTGKMFLDCTYEGDLMAAAGVGYTVGREANSQYDETLSGVQTQQAKYHQFVDGVDPYVVPGDPKSGLLPFIDPAGPGKEGEADKRVQAYCFRMCLTDHPDNRIPFEKPKGYDEQWYELLLRNYEAGEAGMPWINSAMPNRKTDTNNRLGFSTDFIGQNYAWPEASYAERDAIKVRHLLYQQGLMWTLAYHRRMPEKIRNQISQWGMSKDEFTGGNGWQEQLYVREARRLVGDFVMTQNHCQQREKVEDSIGMGAYTMDSHHVQRYVDGNGNVRNEGDVEVGGFPPYPISFRSIVPKASECSNLLVPVCLSASHMAFGSIRMEPVFMVLGQSAATAASLAIDQGLSVQAVEYDKLKARLARDGQVLGYAPPQKTAANYTQLDAIKGVVVDDTQAKLSGAWLLSVLPQGIHKGYRHDQDARNGKAIAVFSATLPTPGEYDVQIAWSPNANRATKVPVEIKHAMGTARATVNQRRKPPFDGLFGSVGRYRFGDAGTITISNADTDGHVIIDAVRWVLQE